MMMTRLPIELTPHACLSFFLSVSSECVQVDLLYQPYSSVCVHKNGDPNLVLGNQERSKYLAAYEVGSQHACFHPVGDLERITFNSPPRVDGLILSFTILMPFVFITLSGCVLLLHKPKPKIDTMVQRTEKMIQNHDKKVKKQKEDHLKEIAMLKASTK